MREYRNIEDENASKSMMQAIHYWINYTCKVSKIDLLVESSIRFPLMEYVERYLHADNCYIERQYADFLKESIFKTPRYVDVMWEKKDTEYLLEIKYLRSSTNQENERQRFFDDLVRLSIALNLKKEKQRKCYFLVCGNSCDFGEQMCGYLNRGDNYGGNLIGSMSDETINTDFSNWLALDEHNTSENKIKHIKYDNEKERFSEFAERYFGTERISSVDQNYHNKYLFPFYTKQIWLSYKNDEKMTGLWEILLME